MFTPSVSIGFIPLPLGFELLTNTCVVSITTVVGVFGAPDVTVVGHDVVGLVLAHATLGGPIDNMHTRMRTCNMLFYFCWP